MVMHSPAMGGAARLRLRSASPSKRNVPVEVVVDPCIDEERRVSLGRRPMGMMGVSIGLTARLVQTQAYWGSLAAWGMLPRALGGIETMGS